VLLLAAAGLVAAGFGEWVEAGAIGAVLVVNTAIGFFTELRSVRSMEALRELGQVRARVRRGGREEEVPAQDLVPGDVVVLDGGDVITADLRVVEASKLAADESVLTGESVPVGKAAGPDPADAALADRRAMLHKGTSLTRGRGWPSSWRPAWRRSWAGSPSSSRRPRTRSRRSSGASSGSGGASSSWPSRSRPSRPGPGSPRAATSS